MINRRVRITAGVLSGVILFTGMPVEMLANPSAAETEYIEVGTSFSAGAHFAISESVVLNEDAGVTENDAPVVAEAEVTEYSNVAIAQVNAYLNVRAEANEDAEVVGKLYGNGAATVLEALDGWYKIESGNVVGYVSADYVVVGDEEVCKAASERIATVTTTTLKLRKEASTESGVYTLLSEDQALTVVDESVENWYKVQYDSYEGYVSAEYVSVETVYTYAESKEEEEARLAAEAEARRIAEANNNANKNNTTTSSSSSNKTYSAPSGSSGQAVVDYAVQFVGNPYVWGGTSLTNGADCSGFIMSVYAAFGVSLPHSSLALRNVGYAVDASQVQPGDIICYSGHVAIYIGNGKIVHASNKKDGIKISNNWQYKTVKAIRRIF